MVSVQDKDFKNWSTVVVTVVGVICRDRNEINSKYTASKMQKIYMNGIYETEFDI